MTFAEELMTDLKTQFEETIASIKSYRDDSSMPALPLFGAEIAPADASSNSLGDLLEVLTFQRFEPALSAVARGEHVARAFLALDGRAPTFQLVIALQNIERDRDEVVTALVTALAAANTEKELRLVSEILRYLVDDGGFRESVRAGAAAWPPDSSVVRLGLGSAADR